MSQRSQLQTALGFGQGMRSNRDPLRANPFMDLVVVPTGAIQVGTEIDGTQLAPGYRADDRLMSSRSVYRLQFPETPSKFVGFEPLIQLDLVPWHRS